MQKFKFLKRKITKTIDNWYKSNDKAILIDGARQIGKTTVIKSYLKENKLNYIEINLFENSLLLEAFNTSTTADELMLRILALTKVDDFNDNFVIFVDEIQAANDAITTIKFLVQNYKNKFIFSGSLLGIKLKNITSFPVGFLNIIQMYPLDFEEFSNAIGISDKIIELLKDSFINLTKVDDIIHKQMCNLFQLYLVVGGMPEAVSEYLNTKDINKVNKVLEKIYSNYLYDISKYKLEESLLIQDIYELIPSELNNQNKRFILKKLNEKARFYTYETSFAWLKNAGVGIFVHNVDNPIYPLLASKERTLFKLFLSDVGLLTYKLFNGNQGIMLLKENKLNYGAIYENFVASELKANGFELYYNNDKKRGEVDFLIEQNNKIIPIEVKSGKDYKRHSALNNLLNNSNFNIDKAYVLTNSNLEIKNNKIYLPIYMTMFFNNKREDKEQIINIDISNLV